KPLRESLLDPAAVRAGDETAIRRLTEGLFLSGFAMQRHQSSRPASGAEHQFSHLWDMQHATAASHGFKVGVATVAVARLYERLMNLWEGEPSSSLSPYSGDPNGNRAAVDGREVEGLGRGALGDAVPPELFTDRAILETARRETAAKGTADLQKLNELW